MAVLQLAPGNDPFERAQSLSRIARALLAVRLVCCLLVTVWLVLEPAYDGLAPALFLASGWLLVLLLRWSTFGVVVCAHPAILALDGLACFVALAMTKPVSPMLLLLGSGCLLTGLCLDRRGAWVFAPMIAAGWWLVYSQALGPDQSSELAGAFTDLVLVPTLLVGTLFAGSSIRRAAFDAAAAERTVRDQLRVAGVAEERARLAREMHDSLVKSLHGIALMASSLPRWVDTSPERAREQAVTIAELINRASKESRELIVAMRRAPAGTALDEVVSRTVERWQASSGHRGDVEVVGHPALPAESTHELSAILGEALENISRHTPAATRAEVRLAARDGWVTLDVVDDGGGVVDDAELVRPGHFGLIGMRERAARVGGDLQVDNVPGVGMSVRVRMPAVLDEPVDLDGPGGSGGPEDIATTGGPPLTGGARDPQEGTP